MYRTWKKHFYIFFGFFFSLILFLSCEILYKADVWTAHNMQLNLWLLSIIRAHKYSGVTVLSLSKNRRIVQQGGSRGEKRVGPHWI